MQKEKIEHLREIINKRKIFKIFDNKIL